jgi:hypothetical protein
MSEQPHTFPPGPEIEYTPISKTRERLIRLQNWFVLWAVRRIDSLAGLRRARAETRAKRKALARVISAKTRCRGCGDGKSEKRLEFERIQPTANDPSTAAIKLTCLRCGAYWFTPTVQPASEWVVPLPVTRNPMVR